MASVGKDSKGYRVRFVMPDGTNKTIRLSGFKKSTAQDIARHIEELIAAKAAGAAIDRRTANWLAVIGQNVHDKLSNAGLIPPREACTLGMFLKGYLLRRANVKPSTMRKWQSAVNHLIAHLGDDRDLRSINDGHADEFRSFLYSQPQAENTVRRYCGLAKQFFRAAQRRKLIEDNPFADQVATVTGNAAKFYFVSREDTAKILKACPDLQWRMIIALTRFGGLRCPSEVLALNWEDIDWQEKRFTATSPKTEHHEGGESRVVPLAPPSEQKKIAAILSTWDRAIELTEKLIAAKQKRKQALMQQLLTGRVRLPEFQGGKKNESANVVRVPAAVRRGIYPPSVQAGIPKITHRPDGWQETTMDQLLRIKKRSIQLVDDTEYQLVVAKRNRGGIEPRQRLLRSRSKDGNAI